MTNRLTTRHLNIAIDLAEANGCAAQNITSIVVSENGEAVTIGLGVDKNGLARFVSNHSFGM